MTASLIPTPVMQFLDADGNPLVGGKVYTYAAGTSTPLATYTNYGGGTPNANPVILNSRGEASIWFGTAAYKLELYTAATVLIWTADNVSASTPVVYGTGVAAALAINVGTAGSILVNGGALVGTTLSASGTSTMAAITASGIIQSNASAGALTLAPTTGTAAVYTRILNTGGENYLGVDSSTNSVFGNGAYDLNIYSASQDIHLSPAGTKMLSLTSTGVTIPGTLGVTGAVNGVFTNSSNGSTSILAGTTKTFTVTYTGGNSQATATVGFSFLGAGGTSWGGMYYVVTGFPNNSSFYTVTEVIRNVNGSAVISAVTKASGSWTFTFQNTHGSNAAEVSWMTSSNQSALTIVGPT